MAHSCDRRTFMDERRAMVHIRKFCGRTNLHGFGSFTSAHESGWAFKIFWLTVLYISVFGGLYFITDKSIHYLKTSVKITYDKGRVSRASVEFPTIIMCNFNQLQE